MPPESVPNKVFTAKLKEIKNISGDINEITIITDQPFTFEAGQYVWIEIPKLKYPDPRGERRAFSLTNIPDGNVVQTILRGSDSGYKKTLLESKPGDPIIIHGPFGSFIKEGVEGTDDLIFISGGLAVAPFLSIIRKFTAEAINRNIALIQVSKNQEEEAYSAELKDFAAKNNNLIYIPILGRIDEATIKETNLKFPSAQWYITGPQGFIEEINTFLTNSGVKPEKKHYEEHYPITSEFSILSKEQLQSTSKSFFKTALDEAFIHIIITDINGKVIYANHAAELITGFKFSEMEGQTPRLWGGLMSPEFYRELWKTKKTNKAPFNGEIVNRRKNGEIYIARSTISPIFGEDGKVAGFIGTEEDITKSKNLSREIEEQKTKYEALLTSIGDGIIVTDSSGDISIVNDPAEKILGISKEEVYGKKLIDVVKVVNKKGEPVPEKDRPFEKAISTMKPFSTSIESEYYYVRHDGTKIPVALDASPVVIKGKLIGVIDVFRDISHEKEVDRMKTEFVSLSSHQLRTPLTAIKWGLESLIRNDEGNLTERQKEYLADIDSSNERMIDLVNSLLNISRIESGRIIVAPVPTNIVKLANDVIGKLKIEMAKKNITLMIDIPQDLPEINLDYNLIFNVYQNLLTNAIAYSPAGGKIEVSIKTNGEEIISSVKDSGIGIPEEEKAHMFEKFYRASNAKKVRPDGSGLGLYIVKSIIESSGGRIWFESTPGKGTTFSFSLPLSGMKPKEGEVTIS